MHMKLILNYELSFLFHELLQPISVTPGISEKAFVENALVELCKCFEFNFVDMQVEKLLAFLGLTLAKFVQS